MQWRQFTRRTVIATNILFVFVGIAVIVLGVYGSVKDNELKRNNPFLDGISIKKQALIMAAAGWYHHARIIQLL